MDKSVGRVGVRILNRGKQEYDVNIGPKIKSILGWYMVYDEIFIVFPDLDYQTRLPYKWRCREGPNLHVPLFYNFPLLVDNVSLDVSFIRYSSRESDPT